MQAGQVISISPSFNSYSNTNLAEIAARVVREKSEFVEKSDESDEFEFATRNTSDFSSPISADDIFYNGQIRPVYPVFNRDILFGHVKIPSESNTDPTEGPKIRLPLRKLFNEERETAMTTTTSSSSSSEADDLNGVPEETYCVWTPKSNSKRWKFKDLLSRSHSDGGKDSFVFLTHSGRGRKNETEEKVEGAAVGGGKVKSTAPAEPCKRNLVGLFGNVNGSVE